MLLLIYYLITYRIVVTVVTVVTIQLLVKVSEDYCSYILVTAVTCILPAPPQA